MSGVQSSWNNTQTYMNQYSRLGNRQPPNMVNVPSDLLQAASPKVFDFNAGTKVDMTTFMAVTSNCRTYSGYSGLRQLQALNPIRTAHEPGCGWILTPGGGGRGAYGVNGLPTLSMTNELDEIKDEKIYVQDLVDAERRAIGNIANTIDSCSKMSILPYEDKPFIGYCKTPSSRQIIPIVTTDNGQTVKARFPKDIKYGCVASDIVPSSNTSLCPTSESFKNYKSISSRNFDRVEGFVDNSFLETCEDIPPGNPEWAGCVSQAASALGCRKTGTLYQDPTGETAAYRRAFQILGNPAMNNIDNVYKTINQKIVNTVGETASKSAAIQELCFQKNYLQENYNWCTEMDDKDTINATNFECVENIWRNKGADTMGISAPSFTKWQGKTFQAFREYATSLMTNTTEVGKDKQVLAIARTIGTPTYGQTYSATN
jgi:hypothetical protein